MEDNKLSEIAATLQELLKWTRFAGMNEVKKVLSSALDSEVKTVIYHNRDGSKSSPEIANIVKVSDWTIRNYWKSWSKLGIVEALQVGRGERYRKAFDIEDFGFDIPNLSTVNVASARSVENEDSRLGELNG
jgi:Fic family protein